MRTYKGIVCEKKSKYSVFLTEEGKFLRGIPVIPNPEIGEEVEFQLVKGALQQKRAKPFFIGPALVAAVLLVFLVASFIPKTSSALAAYVQLEGETALELGVNQKGNVVSLRSLANEPISMGEWEGLPLAIVLDKAVSQMNPKVEKLEIIMVYENEEPAAKKIVEEAVRTVQNEHTNRTWHVSESTEEERTKANKNNQTIKQLRKTEQVPAIKKEQKPAPAQPSTPETKQDMQQAPPKEIPQPKVEKQQIKQEKQEEKSQKKNEKEEQKVEKKNNGNQGNNHNNNQGNENSNKENKPHNNQGNNNTNNQENKNSNNQGNKNKEGNNNNKQ
ncbi:hypothetical protein [Psychrobacillus sp. NEAU-3TGS]|uniref:anti-sigma factor domain-containing protein n=1 Tax=Psychrobacillus sp. NEAU-3TGS TaxID=2995412 RepID=UPI00249AF016|nr:hypothetical protein [Psychrobacillus sp. NEAU-3TGS]